MTEGIILIINQNATNHFMWKVWLQQKGIQAQTIFKAIYLYIKNVTSPIFPAHILQFKFFLAIFSNKDSFSFRYHQT